MIKIFIFFSLLFSVTCFAQTLSYKNYTVEDGLASSTVYHILQDKKGYLWFATETGVSRFDGTNFTAHSEGLSDNTVLRFFEDSKQRIWTITLSGKLFYYRDGRFILFDSAGISKKFLINSLVEDCFGNTWLSAFYSGIIKYSKTGKFKYYNRTNLLTTRGTTLFTLYESNGTLWTYDGGKLLHINDSVFEWFPIKKNFSTAADVFLGSSVKDKVYYYNNSQVVVIKSDNDQNFIVENIKNRSIRYVMEDHEGDLLVATNKGILVYDIKGRVSYLKRIIFQEKDISYILEDKEKNLWVATQGEGVYFLPTREIYSYTQAGDLPDDKVQVVGADREGNMWAGTNNGCAVKLVSERWMEYAIELNKTSNNRVTCMLGHSDGSTWFGKDNGVYILPGATPRKNNRLTKIGAVKSICEGVNGEVWIATHYAIFRVAGDTLIPLATEIGRTTAIYKDSKSILWLANEKGLYTYDGRSLAPYKDSSLLLKHRITQIHESNNDVLWFSTQGSGMVALHDNKTYTISAKNGLASDICNSFFMDGNHKIWVATNKGLSKIEFLHEQLSRFKIYNYTSQHGLASNEINSVYKKGDTVWAATNKGLNFFNEKKIKPNSVPPPIYLTHIRIMDVDTAICADYDLAYHNNNIKIDYVGLAYRNKGNVTYKYQMTGIDTGWNRTQHTYAQYPKLPPGQYTFRVSAMNEDGYWSEVPATARFIIRPPFWKTPAFIISFSLLVALIIWIAVSWRIRSIRKSSALYQQMIEAEQKALRAQMNPHFIFNAMNSIQNFIANKDQLSAHEYLGKFGELIRRIFNNSKQHTIPITDELATLELYLELEALRFQNKFEYSIITDEQIDKENGNIPPMLIQPYIENAIWHGLMHKDTKGKLLVEFQYISEQAIRCIVEDNGVGIKQAMAYKAKHKRSPVHQSSGMQLTKERIEMTGKQKKANAGVKVIDLFDGQNEPAGTRVEIEIPVEY